MGVGGGVVTGVAVIILAVSLLGFGVTGFNSPAADFGENLLGFELNPLVNLIHLGLGLALLIAAYTSRPASITLGVGLILLAIGLAGAGDGVPLPAILTLLDSDSLESRLGACEALAKLKGKAAPAVPALRGVLRSDELWLRIRAAEAHEESIAAYARAEGLTPRERR